MEEHRTEFTHYMQTLIGGVMERIKTFYCREDFSQKVREVMLQYEKKRSGYEFRLKELNEMCDACGLDVAELCDPETVQQALAKIPTRKELRKKLLQELHGIFLEFPSSSAYMARLVHRLDGWRDEPVRLTIVRKFLLETSYHTQPVLDYVFQKLSTEEKALCKALSVGEQAAYLAARLDDDIFSVLSRNTAELSPAHLLQLLIRQQKLDAAGLFRFSDAILHAVSALLGSPAPEDTSALLHALENTALNSDLLEAMEQEFCAYLKPLGKDKTYKQAKKDQKKAVKTDWTLLKLADDLATGKFRVNGITREQLYVFAIAFGMRYYPDTESPDYDPVLDVEKNLFQDYYSDNLLRYVLDEEYIHNRSYYDAQPTGEGINFKNYVEVIYLYYLAADHGLSPAGKLERTQALIDKCVKAAKKHPNRITEAPSDRTHIFRAGFLQELLEITEESQLLDYLCTHYYIYNPSYGVVRMMYSAQQNTTKEVYLNLLGTFLKEYPEAFGSANDRVELNNGIDLPALVQQLTQENRDDPQFLQLLEQDSPFMTLLVNLNQKLQPRKSLILKLYNDPESAAAYPYTRTELIALYYCYFLNVLQELVEDYGILDLPQLYEEFCNGDGIRPGINDYLVLCRYQRICEKNPFDMFVVFSLFLELIRWDD